MVLIQSLAFFCSYIYCHWCKLNNMCVVVLLELLWYAENVSLSLGRTPSLSDERVKLFASRCVDLGKSLGVDVVDLYTLFHQQPVSSIAFHVALPFTFCFNVIGSGDWVLKLQWDEDRKKGKTVYIKKKGDQHTPRNCQVCTRVCEWLGANINQFR